MPDLSHLSGWDDNNQARHDFAARSPVLSQVAPHLYRGVDDKPLLLYKAWKDVLGKYPDYIAQAIGDCTSFGTGHVVDLTECIQISLGANGVFKETSTEAIYGCGREIAGMLGGGDGCFGGAVAKAVSDFGTVSREQVGAYSGRRAQTWGSTGVPSNFKKLCTDHKIQAYALVQDPDDVDAALSNGYAGIVCSNQGFSMTRDDDGVCRPKGSWSHCMAWVGRRIKSNRRQYLIIQSWGPDTPSGPTTDDQPDFSFWIDEGTFASMLSGNDSYVLSKFVDYPGQVLPEHWTPEGFA